MELLPREAELVARAVRGDEVARTTLLAQSRGLLVNYIAARIPANLRGTLDADDVVQQTHVEVFRHFDEFTDAGPRSFMRWTATIALRRLRDALRRQRAAKRGGVNGPALAAVVPCEDSLIALLDQVAATGRSPSRSFARREALEALQTAMDQLPPEQRAALSLVSVECRSVAEAAQTLGRSERAIHNLCYKARKRLRELLGERERYFSSPR